MSNFVGGDVLEIVCTHPTLGDFRFFPKSNESFTVDRGGIRNSDDANNVTSSGQIITQKNRVRWSIEGPVAVDQGSGKDQNDLNALAESPELGIWTLTHISGNISKGKGEVVGDLQIDTNNSQLTLKVSGGGTLEKI